MHNRKGAFSETLYIYGEALKRANSFNLRELSVLSVGLGLGYNEWLTLAHGLQNPGIQMRLSSFESHPDFREGFLNFVWNRPLPALLKKAFQDSLDFFVNHFKVSAETFKTLARTAHDTKLWLVHHEFNAQRPPTSLTIDRPFEVILFDPFSANTTPELWSVDALTCLFTSWTAPCCVFSTYAAKGELKRQFRTHGFQLESRPGYQGKRESTLALRKR